MKNTVSRQKKDNRLGASPKEARQETKEPSSSSFIFILCLVAASSTLYLLLSHIFFPNFALPESHEAIIILDSLVATLVAFLVMRKIYRLSDERRLEKLRADEAEVSVQSYARRLIEASLDPMVTISPDGRRMVLRVYLQVFHCGP